MADHAGVGDETQLRARMIAVGLSLSALVLGAVLGYILLTWSHPHRGGLLAVWSGALVATLGIATLPRQRIAESRHRERYLLGWSLSLIAFIAFAASLDTGVRSPLVLVLYLTLVYAALSYSRWAMGVVAASTLLAVVVLSLIAYADSQAVDWRYVGGLMFTLATAGLMCLQQVRLHEGARAVLERVSRTDPLTGVLNRLGFGERLAGELRRAAETGEPVALVLLDFDDFKAVNDRDGHPAGDELLRWAADAMAHALRPGDALGRLGGDEFAAILPATGVSAARNIAERLGDALAARVKASAGVAGTDLDGVDAIALHRLADQRLYAAKRGRGTRAGRLRVVG